MAGVNIVTTPPEPEKDHAKKRCFLTIRRINRKAKTILKIIYFLFVYTLSGIPCAPICSPFFQEVADNEFGDVKVTVTANIQTPIKICLETV